MEPRKATDILLAIEAKLDQVLAQVRATDLNSKILSNKLNSLMEVLSSMNLKIEDNESKPTIEATEAPPPLHLTVEADPLGFRRTSRPETYATPTQLAQVNRPTPPPVPSQPVFDTTQVPGRVPPPSQEEEEWKTVSMPALPRMQSEEAGVSVNRASVEQRVVDKNGKAVFLANVEIFNKSTNKLETKTRTTSMGKWQAVLPPGIYDVKITKSESMSKEKIEFKQQINVDGKSPTQQLPLVIAK